MNSTEPKAQDKVNSTDGSSTKKDSTSKIKLKTKDSNEIICKKCNTHFDSMDKLIYLSGYKAYSICPKCGHRTKVTKITQSSDFLVRRDTGQYVRKIPKTGLSKKARRRIAKDERANKV